MITQSKDHNSETESNRYCTRHMIIPIKFHQDISNDYGVMGRTRKGITWKLKTWKQCFLQATHRLYLIHIPIKFHEYIPNDYRVMGCTRIKITQNKQNINQKEGDTNDWCTSRADSDEIPLNVAFYLGLHCLPKYPLWGFQSTKGLRNTIFCTISEQQGKRTIQHL